MPRKFDFLSPGIEIREVDQSILPAQVDADGPIIIGRFRKGPGMKPAKVRSLDYFIDVYGNPVPGGSSLKGDIWRDGPQLSAPTYAAYAAQSWLASRTSPVNVVRLLGDQHPQAVNDSGYAGWQLSGSGGVQVTTSAATNSTAYGLFVSDLSKLSQTTPKTLIYDTDGGSAAAYNGKTLTIQRDNVTKVIFTFTNVDTSGKNGTAEKIDATNITLYIFGLNAAAIMTLIETGFELAASEGMLSDFSIDNNSTNLEIFNLSTSETIEMQSSQAGNFKLEGSGLDSEQTIAVATTAIGEGTLAAVFYVNSGYMTLVGTDAHGGTTAATTGEIA